CRSTSTCPDDEALSGAHARPHPQGSPMSDTRATAPDTPGAGRSVPPSAEPAFPAMQPRITVIGGAAAGTRPPHGVASSGSPGRYAAVVDDRQTAVQIVHPGRPDGFRLNAHIRTVQPLRGFVHEIGDLTVLEL